MRRTRILLFLGVWIAVLPYLGFPSSWKDVLSTLSGLGLIVFSYFWYMENKEKNEQMHDPDSFIENNNFTETIEITTEEPTTDGENLNEQI